MNVTLEELKERLAQRVDEVSLLEILNITATDIVEAFSDRIGDRFELLSAEYFDDSEDDNESE